MKKHNILTYVLGLSLLITSSLFSQNEGVIDNNTATVYLKTGSRIQGKIIEWNIGESITLEMPWGANVRLLQNQIKKVLQHGTNHNPQAEYNFKEVGHYLSGKIQVISGNEGNRARGVYGYGGSFSAGHRFNRLLAVGGGIGYDKYIWDSGEQLVPIFAEVGGFLSPKLTTLVYNLQVGYSLAFDNDNFLLSNSKGGMMYYPSIGIRFGKENTKFTLDLGYKFQSASYNYGDIWSSTRRSEQDVDYKRLVLRFGFLL